jgi:epoxyqueuosine reductase
MSLEQDITSLARVTGFHAVGITSAEPFVESARALRERYDKGLLEGSGYDPEVIRLYTTPTETLITAKSIISVALSYLSEDADQSEIRNPKSEIPRGLMACFSRGLDYHQVIQERLFALAGDLGSHVEVRSFADTGPLVDRSAAIRAGIGSRGKNTCVYAGEYGSWVVLGELLTDLEIEPDPPAPLDICGECDECMKACPTGAISAPYTVDARICLSRVTQSKGFIPHSLREKMGARIYGCDTCQSACPLNKDSKPGNVEEFRPSMGLGASPELPPLLNMTPEEFKERVAQTTAGWIRRTRFRRNVAIALGNVGDPVAVPGLVEALADPEPVIRGHAAWALGRIVAPGVRGSLETALTQETDVEAAAEIRAAIEGLSEGK